MLFPPYLYKCWMYTSTDTSGTASTPRPDWWRRPEPARPDHPAWTRSGILSHHQTSGSTNSERSSQPRRPLIGRRIWGDAAGPTSNRHPLRPFASFSWGLPLFILFFSLVLLYSLSLCPLSTSTSTSILSSSCLYSYSLSLFYPCMPSRVFCTSVPL